MTLPASAGPELRLLVDDALMAVIEIHGRADVQRAVAAAVARSMATFGIPEVPRVVIDAPAGGRAISVLIDGVTATFPPAFMRRLWNSLSPDGSDEHAVVLAEAGYPDTWLITRARTATAPGREHQRDVIITLLIKLVPEIVALQPARLLTTHAVAGMLQDCQTVDADELAAVMRGLLDRGVSVVGAPELALVVRSCRAAGHSLASTLEESYARLRSPNVSIIVGDTLFDELVPTGQSLAQLDINDGRIDSELVFTMSVMREHRLLGLGITQPTVLVRNPEMDDDEFRVRVNQRIGPPIQIPRRAELGVSAAPAELAGRGISARPLADPVSSVEPMAVLAADADAVRAAGFLPVSRSSYVATSFARAMTPSAYRLISIDTVEEYLANAEYQFASLVHGTLSRFGLVTVTELLRELVREQVSILDPCRILGAALRFAELPHEIPRELVDAIVPPSGSGLDRRTRDLLAFVRMEIRDQVCFDSGGVGEIAARAIEVFETDERFENRVDALLAIAGRRSDSGRTDALAPLRDDVWRGLGNDPPPEPVLLTAPRIRRALRDTVAQELPTARVLSRSEVPAGTSTRCLGMITAAP